MPKRRINIQTFAGLASPALDDEDVPLEGASFASGLDPTERPGRLRGFPGDENTGLGDAVKAYAMLDGGDTIIYWDGSNVKKITGAEDGIGGSSSTVDGGGNFSTPTRPQMTSDGERVYIGRGKDNAAKWVGEYRRKHPHDGSLPNSLQVDDAALQKPEGHELILLGLRGSDSDNLEDGLQYQFAISWVYDGFQEGPLHLLDQSFIGGGEREVDLRLKWTQSDAVNTSSRVTHINLYSIAGAGNQSSPIETGKPTLVKSIPVDGDWITGSNAGVSIKSNPGWTDVTGTSTVEWEAASNNYVYNGEDRGSSNSPLKNEIVVSGFTSGDLTTFTATGTLYAAAVNGSGASATITVKVEDSDGNAIDSATQTVDTKNFSGGDSFNYDDAKTVSFELTVGTFTPANAHAIQVNMVADSGGDYSEAKSTVEDVLVQVQGGDPGDTFVHNVTWNGASGTPYRDRTGLSPTNEQPSLDYGVTAEHSGYHFVTQASVGGDSYGSYIFRSKAQRFSQFAWAQDYLNLETEAHSLVSFNGRLWAFSNGAAYRIDPNTLTVERAYKGKGAIGRTSITRSPMGLFWCSRDNIHLYDGRELRDVGNPIRASEDFSDKVWNAVDTSSSAPAPTTWYSPEDNLLVVAFRSTSDTNEAWMLHFPEERWTEAIPGPRWMHLEPPSGALDKAILGTDGVPYFSIGGELKSFATADSLREWEWTSKEITAGEPASSKVFYRADVKGDEPTSVEYQEDEGSWQTAPLDSTNANRSRWTVNSSASSPPWNTVYHFRLKIEGGPNDEVSSLSFLTRFASPTQ